MKTLLKILAKELVRQLNKLIEGKASALYQCERISSKASSFPDGSNLMDLANWDPDRFEDVSDEESRNK